MLSCLPKWLRRDTPKNLIFDGNCVRNEAFLALFGGCSSVVERMLPKHDIVGSSPITRLRVRNHLKHRLFTKKGGVLCLFCVETLWAFLRI